MSIEPVSASPQVFDNALSDPLCSLLADELSDEINFVFDRRNVDKTPAETIIDTLLNSLNDNTPYVEYWCRRRQEKVPAHLDCDEARLLRGEFIVPEAGHVLTIDAQPHASTTWVWQRDSLWIIPVVRARLSRFDGRCPHSVPHPRSEYLSTKAEGENISRFVLLFNTWNETPEGWVQSGEPRSHDLRGRQSRCTVKQQKDLSTQVENSGMNRVVERTVSRGETTVLRVPTMDTLQSQLQVPSMLRVNVRTGRSALENSLWSAHTVHRLPIDPLSWGVESIDRLTETINC